MTKKALTILFILFLLNIILLAAVFQLPGNHLEASFFDVGQGSAVFIEKGKLQILIDGGPSSKIIEKLGKEMPFWDRTIDLVVLTHPDKDHMAGLLEVLERYRVKNILGINAGNIAWQEEIEKEEAVKRIAEKGQKIIIGDNSFFEVLNPKEGKAKDDNDSSVVLKLTDKDVSFLFTGDISKEKEKELSEDIDVLQVSHHGSKNSTSEEFLKKASPDVAVIQVGKNSYGHPASQVLERLAKFGINVLRTDIDGDVKIVSDGNNIKIIK